jgi:hypothetical protein
MIREDRMAKEGWTLLPCLDEIAVPLEHWTCPYQSSHGSRHREIHAHASLVHGRKELSYASHSTIP